MIVESVTVYVETSGGIRMPFFLPARVAQAEGVADGATVERRTMADLNKKKALFMMGFVEKIHTATVDFIFGLAQSLPPEEQAKLLWMLQGGQSENEAD